MGRYVDFMIEYVNKNKIKSSVLQENLFKLGMFQYTGKEYLDELLIIADKSPVNEKNKIQESVANFSYVDIYGLINMTKNLLEDASISDTTREAIRNLAIRYNIQINA